MKMRLLHLKFALMDPQRNTNWKCRILCILSIMTGSLCVQDVNSIDNNQPWKEGQLWDPKLGPSSPSRTYMYATSKLSSVQIKHSPERWGWTQVEIPQQAFFRVDCCQYWYWTSGVQHVSNLVLITTVVRCWLLAIDHHWAWWLTLILAISYE